MRLSSWTSPRRDDKEHVYILYVSIIENSKLRLYCKLVENTIVCWYYRIFKAMYCTVLYSGEKGYISIVRYYNRTFKGMYCTPHRWKRICISIVRWQNRTLKAMYCTILWWKRICISIVRWYNRIFQAMHCTVNWWKIPLFIDILEHSKLYTVLYTLPKKGNVYSLYVGTIHRAFKAMCYTIFWWKGICISIVRWYNRTFKSMYCTVLYIDGKGYVYYSYTGIIHRTFKVMYCTVHWWKRISISIADWYDRTYRVGWVDF